MSTRTDDIIDPMCEPDTFATELSSIETIGPVTRLVFTTVIRCGNCNEKKVVARIVLATEMVGRISRQLATPAFALDAIKLASDEEISVHH
jgi:hypothetical protein